MVQGIVPAGSLACELVGEGDAALLPPLELAEVQDAAPRRRSQFAAGRLCARAALAAFGIVDFALRAGPAGRPDWPAGYVGSISHTHGYCAAVVAPAARFLALGLDVETIARVSERVRRHIATPVEQAWLESLAPAQRALAGALLFSAKEAYYKCWSNAGGEMLYFQDVELGVTDLSGGTFAARLLPRRAHPRMPPMPAGGRFALADGRVLSAVAAMAAPGEPAPAP